MIDSSSPLHLLLRSVSHIRFDIHLLITFKDASRKLQLKSGLIFGLTSKHLSVNITLHSKLEIYCIEIASEVPEEKTELVDISTPVPRMG